MLNGSVLAQTSAAKQNNPTCQCNQIHLPAFAPVKCGPDPPKRRKTMKTDPICGMAVDDGTALRAERGSETYYFCGDGCLTKFLASGGNPARSEAKRCCCSERRDTGRNGRRFRLFWPTRSQTPSRSSLPKLSNGKRPNLRHGSGRVHSPKGRASRPDLLFLFRALSPEISLWLLAWTAALT